MAFFDSLFFHLYFSLPLICATFGHFFFFPLHRKTAHAQAHKRGHTQARTAKEPLSLDAHTEGTGTNEPRQKKTLILRRHTSGARYAATNTGIGRSDGPLDSRHAGQGPEPFFRAKSHHFTQQYARQVLAFRPRLGKSWPF